MMDLGQSAKVTDDLQAVSGSMFIRVRRNSLLKSLNRAQGISEKKSINPLFANILLQAQDSRLFLHSANISLLLEDSIAADVKMPGIVSVNASMLYEICRKLPESSELHIEQKESTLTIKSLAAQFELPIFENTHINSNSQSENDPSNKPIMVLLETEVLRNILAKVYFAASVEEVRSYLCGVHIEINGLKLAAVATDGHRLACIETCLEQKEESVASEVIGATIPRKTIAELMRMLKDEEGNIEIAIMQNKITFGWGVIKLTSDLIASKFPPYRSVIPTIDEISNIMTVSTNILRESIDRISLVSSEKKAIKLNIENNSLTISAAATENGRATESLVVQYSGKPLSISFNAKYLLEALYNIEDNNVDLYLRGQTDAVRIIDKKCTDATYVVMPMRL